MNGNSYSEVIGAVGGYYANDVVILLQGNTRYNTLIAVPAQPASSLGNGVSESSLRVNDTQRRTEAPPRRTRGQENSISFDTEEVEEIYWLMGEGIKRLLTG